MRLDVNAHERVLVLRKGRPSGWLGPGEHTINTVLKRIDFVRYDTRELLANVDAEALALLPEGEVSVVTLGELERAVVYRLGKPVHWLETGVHQVWTVLKTVQTVDGERVMHDGIRIERLDVSPLDVKPLDHKVAALVPQRDYLEALVPVGMVGVRYVDGAQESLLRPGRYAMWTTHRQVVVSTVDLKERVLQVGGQELMTRDRVTLRLNASALWRTVDAERMAHVARNPEDVLYLAVQLELRKAVATRNLDELLEGRETLAAEILPVVSERAGAIGAEIVDLGVKDLVLPGEMKTLMNRVIEARKEAEANVILRREETAATRSMAQTAKVLAENPLLIRLKELDAYKELAAQVGSVNVVVGGEMPQLHLSELGAGRK